MDFPVSLSPFVSSIAFGKFSKLILYRYRGVVYRFYLDPD